jgi:Holliday junction resolvase RusA-like endonuclease
MHPYQQHEARKAEKRKVIERLVAAGATPVHGQIEVDLRFVWDDDRQRDIDNVAKFALDALVAAGIIDGDHHQVLKALHLSGACDKVGGKRTEITIREWTA